jgi:hypothetical protein
MPFEVECFLPDDVRELLAVLALRVRVLSVLQIARTWPKAIAALKRLEAQALVLSFTVVAHPELPLNEPIIRWTKSGDLPDFGQASYRLRSRWNLPGVPTKCVIASRAAGRMFGGHGGRYPRESEETHDIHLSAVYLRFRSMSPEAASTWIHEEEIKKERKQRKGKLPDALVGKDRVVEFGGAYKKEKLIRFHKFCVARGFDYEMKRF